MHLWRDSLTFLCTDFLSRELHQQPTSFWSQVFEHHRRPHFNIISQTGRMWGTKLELRRPDRPMSLPSCYTIAAQNRPVAWSAGSQLKSHNAAARSDSAGLFIRLSKSDEHSKQDADAFGGETIKNSHAVQVVHCQNQWAVKNSRSPDTIHQHCNNRVPIHLETDRWDKSIIFYLQSTP